MRKTLHFQAARFSQRAPSIALVVVQDQGSSGSRMQGRGLQDVHLQTQVCFRQGQDIQNQAHWPMLNLISSVFRNAMQCKEPLAELTNSYSANASPRQ